LKNTPYNSRALQAGACDSVKIVLMNMAGRAARWFFIASGSLKRYLSTMFKPVQQASRILIWQFGWVVVSALAFGLLINRQWGWSVLTGAGIGLVATSYVVLVMVKHVLNVTKPATLFTVLITWLIKVMLVVGLLLIALRSPLLTPLAVILGLVGSLMAYWLSMILVSTGK